MNKKFLSLCLAFLIILAGCLLYLNFFVINKRIPVSQVSQPTPNPTLSFLGPTLAKVQEEGGQVPFDYEVVEVLGEMVKIKGLKGEMTLVNNPSVLVFWKKGESIQETDFSSLAVGQKLILERSAPPNREIKVYILQ